ncbi:MAG: translation initiation factor eIF-1A [archaeon]
MPPPRKFDKKKKQKGTLEPQPEFVRVRMPRDNEVLGILESRLGGSRMRVRCFDGRMRICRIPGRLKRRLWVREGDTLLIKPWDLGGDEKGDVVYKYKPNQVSVLKRKGMVKEVIEDMEEF